VADEAGGEAVDANEAEGAQDALRAGDLRDALAVAEAVLKGEDLGAGVTERGEGLCKEMIRGRFPGDHHEVHGADFLWSAEGLGFGEMEVTGDAFEADTIGLHRIEVGAEEKADVLARGSEARAVVEADGSCSDDGD
jgi:hypothetical protein